MDPIFKGKMDMIDFKSGYVMLIEWAEEEVQALFKCMKNVVR